MQVEQTPLPLLVAPLQRRPLPGKLGAMFDNHYTLGWLCKTNTGYGWVTWGLLPKERALQAVQETLQKSGPREVLVWHATLTKDLSAELVAQIRAGQAAAAGDAGAREGAQIHPR